jgi:RNA polymerase sigma factor (sigma-70 family)
MLNPGVVAEVDRIFDKPGREWSDEEYNRVCEWLFNNRQLQQLLAYALIILGDGATAENAEDAWSEFCVRRLSMIAHFHYDPGRGLRFWEYLLFCFKNFCQTNGEELRKRWRREQPIVLYPRQEGGIIEFKLSDSATSSHEALEQAETMRCLQESINKLDHKYRDVLIKHYFEEKPIKELAEELDISLSTVKVRLYRARRMLKERIRGPTRS